MYFDLGDEVGGEGSVVLTGSGAAPPLPPGSCFGTLGSKCATHCRLHLSPDQCCRSKGEQKGVTSRQCMPSTVSSCLVFHLPKGLTLSASPLWKNVASPPLAQTLPVMLADNQVQAFSVASPTAMFSALLRTCDPEEVQCQGPREACG